MNQPGLKSEFSINELKPQKLAQKTAMVLSFFIIGLIINYLGLSAPMYYDSAGWIEKQRHIFDSRSIIKIINIFPQRPLPLLTFYLNYLMTDMAPIYFRLLNIFILACASLIVASLIEFVLSLTYPHTFNIRIISVLTACIFLVHPLQSYLTLYIWQRSALMACFFYFSSLYVYFSTRSGKIKNEFTGYILCFFMFILAFLSKENAITLPIALLLADIAFFKEPLSKIIKRGSVYILVTFLCAAVLSTVERAHGSADFSPGIINTISQYYKESGLTFYETTLTQSRVFFSYMSAIFLPLPSSVQLISPQMISRSLCDPPTTLIAVAGAGIFLLTGIYLLYRRPLWGFGMLFFLINLLPESFLVPQYQFFGYRASLPMFGLLLIVADCFVNLPSIARSSDICTRIRNAVPIVASLVIVGLSLVTIHKANIWSDPISFWTDIVSQFPEKAKNLEKHSRMQALHNLGISFQERGQFDQAFVAFERAYQLAPDETRTLNSLASTCIKLGKFHEAEDLLKKVLRLEPKNARAHRHLGELLMSQNKFSEALIYLRKGIELAPHDDDLYDALGRALAAQGEVVPAMAQFRKAIELNPRSYVSFCNLGALLLSENNVKGSIKNLKRSLALRPDYYKAHEGLGIAYAVSNELEKAVTHLREAVRLNPDDPSPKQNLETALRQLNDSKKEP